MFTKDNIDDLGFPIEERSEELKKAEQATRLYAYGVITDSAFLRMNAIKMRARNLIDQNPLRTRTCT